MGNNIDKINLGGANAFLIKNENNFVLIDTGSNPRKESLKEKLLKYSADLNDIDLIIITHVHQDHVEGLAKLQKSTSAKIMLHEKGEQLLQQGQSEFPNGTNWFFRIISKLIKKFKSSGKFETVKPDIIVENEYNLNKFGIEGKVISTPGHTQDSISVIINNKHCFCGDTMFNLFPHSVYPIFANDEQKLLQSWEMLKEYDCNFYYPGHGRKFRREKFIKTYNKYIQTN